MEPTAKRVSKACDACKLRKVKCNGHERCQQCTHLGLRCIYSATTTKRSQGRRGRIISEYKSKTSNATKSSVPMLAATPFESEYAGSQTGFGSVSEHDGGKIYLCSRYTTRELWYSDAADSLRAPSLYLSVAREALYQIRYNFVNHHPFCPAE
jgi:hypothetical protein